MEKYNILIIDDDPDFQLLIEYSLSEIKRSCYDVRCCEDATEGLAMILSEKWDAVLLDYRLKDENGLELLEKVSSRHLSFPVILMTGQDGGDIDMLAMEAGASDYLVKDEMNGAMLDRCIRYSMTSKASEESLRVMALTDPLTELANRKRFLEALHEAKSRSIRSGNKFAMFFIDIDHFKQINDTVGHSSGDAALVYIARMLKEKTRNTDVIARLGGDEFSIIMEDIRDEQDAVLLARKILDASMNPISVGFKKISIRLSIGISIFPDDSLNIEALINASDTAMYSAKGSGRNTYKFFSSDMQAKAQEKADIEHALALAIQKNEFDIYYQPKINSKTEKCIGAEALLRWNRNGNSSISPAIFIPIAEQCGLIHNIGFWVMEEVCLRIVEMNRDRETFIPIAVNVSTRQLTSEYSFVDFMINTLERTQCPVELLEIEITETALASDPEKVMEQIEQLHKLGITISIDDFGTGYSSLVNLVNMPVDCLKIDRSFVSECIDSLPHRRIVEATCSLAKNLNMSIVAEGVEDKHIASFMKALGCDFIQGYYYSRPIPLPEFYATYTSELIDNSQYRGAA